MTEPAAHPTGPSARPHPERIRWGILATGNIAGKFVEDLRLLRADAEVVAVGSRNEDSAQAFAGRYGIPRAHGSWQALADDPDVDVVYIATPHIAHFAATMTCIEAGKAVLTEKPFTLDLESAETLVEAARTAGVFAMEAMWMRCFPVIGTVAGLIADGAIGDVTAVQADFGLAGPFEPTHRLRAKALGGGALLDLGIYPLTFAHLILGTPDTIAAWARLTDEGIDENTGALFGYASGALAQISCSIVGDTPRRAAITGTAGRIELPRNFYRPTSYTVWRDEKAETTDMRFKGWGYHFEAAEVHRCLREGLTESPVVPLAETLAVMKTLDAVRETIGVTYS
jgi:predicted dehydrogenase